MDTEPQLERTDQNKKSNEQIAALRAEMDRLADRLEQLRRFSGIRWEN